MPPTITNFATLQRFIRPYNLSFQQITSNYFKFTDLGRSFQPCCQILANWSQSKVEKQKTVKGSLYLIVTHAKPRIGAFVSLKEWGTVYCILYNLLCFSVTSSLFFFLTACSLPFFTYFEFIFDICALSAPSMWLGALPLEEKLEQHV